MSANASKTLRLVQFNVENLFLFLDLYNGQDLSKITEAEWQKFSSSSTPNKSLYKTRALAAAIEDMAPDILMLNEVGGLDSINNFNEHFLRSQYTVYLKEGNSRRGIDVGYLIRKGLPSKPLLITHRDRPIQFLYPHENQTPSGGKSHYFSRDVAELRLFDPGQNSPRLVVLLTHLKSKLDTERIDPEGRLRRAAELRTLSEIYNEVKKELDGKAPIIVAGDFNGIASPNNTEPEFHPLYDSTDLLEVFETLQKPKEERYTQVQISPLLAPQYLQIDYIFASPHLRDRIVRDETFVYRFRDHLGQVIPPPRNLDERSQLPSDHYPVVLTIS